jgi:hypothetical protein
MDGSPDARAAGGRSDSGSRAVRRRRLLRGGIALGWLLFAGGVAQLAWKGTSPVLAGVSATGTDRAPGLAEAGSSGTDVPAAPIALSLDQALEAALLPPDAMPAVIEAWRQAGRLPLDQSIAMADALLLHARELGPTAWRQRAGCFTLAGHLLLGCCHSIPAELERAGDAMLVAMPLYMQNGAGSEAGSAARLARRSYEQILGDSGVSDRQMVDAVRRKLARVNAASPGETQESLSP